MYKLGKTPQRLLWLVTGCLALLAIVVAGLLLDSSFTVSAQGEVHAKTATPQPTPTNNGGSAKWTINSMTYTSNYPKGFDFALDATSSAGKIVEATATWSYRVGLVNHAGGVIDPSGKITAIFEQVGGLGIPQWIGVTYWWVLKDSAGNVYQTDSKYDEYADHTRGWRRIESEDIIVFWQDSLPERVGQDALNAMHYQRGFYLQNWGRLLNYKPRAIIYDDYTAFEEWNQGVSIRSPKGVHIGGLTSDTWGGTAQVIVPQSDIRTTTWGTVLHEVDHLYQGASGAATNLTWFIEGDASYFELAPDYDYLERTRQLAQKGNLPTLQGEGPAGQGDDARLAYDIGYSWWVWLRENYGINAHYLVWHALAHGKTVPEAIEQVTGMNFVDMETAFRKWLGAPNPVPPTLIPTEEFEFPPTPTYEPTSAPTS